MASKYNYNYRYRPHKCHESGAKHIQTLYRTTVRCMHCGTSNFQMIAEHKMECFNCGLSIEDGDDHPYLRIKPFDHVSYGTPEQYDEFVNMIVHVLNGSVGRASRS